MNHKAGRELDVLVRTIIIGDKRDWHDKSFHDQTHGDTSCGHCTDWVPKYSTDISAAWEVVEKLHELFPNYYIDINLFPGGRYVTTLLESAEGAIFHANEGGDTAPLSICRAALQAHVKD